MKMNDWADEPTNAGSKPRFEKLPPLESERDDLIEVLLPLVPECERLGKDYLADGFLVG
jgi:hypothetical protein